MPTSATLAKAAVEAIGAIEFRRAHVDIEWPALLRKLATVSVLVDGEPAVNWPIVVRSASVFVHRAGNREAFDPVPETSDACRTVIVGSSVPLAAAALKKTISART